MNKNMELDKQVKQYILDAICADGYSNEDETDIVLKDSKESLDFLFRTFRSEYGWNISRVGECRAFQEWLPGLPSCFNIDFENYKILELARNWGSLDGLTGKALERREDFILENWWNFITVKTFQLAKKYKVDGVK